MASSSSPAVRGTACTPSIMLNVSKCIGKDWRFLGRQLDIEEAILEDIEDRCKTYGFQEMAYQTMVIWQQTLGKGATISVLEATLLAIDRADIITKCFPDSKLRNIHPTSKPSNDQKTHSPCDKVHLLKNIQERLRSQYNELEMKGLPWMEELVLTLDEYYIDLSMSRMDRNGTVLQSTIQIDEILETDNGENVPTRILIEGDPGHGKSTLAAKLAYDWAKGKTYMKHYDLVFLLPLRHLTEDFEETIRKATSVNINDKELLLEILNDKSKHILLILDGFDEASPKIEKMVLLILQKDIFAHVSVMVTSRPGQFPSTLRLLKSERSQKRTECFTNADFAPTVSYFIDRRVRVEGFTSEQQAAFVTTHLKSCTELQKVNVKSKLEKVKDKEFFKCPLFLLMLIVSLTNCPEDKCFDTKTDFYKHVFNWVIKRYFNKIGDNSHSDIDIFFPDGCTKCTAQHLMSQFSKFALWAIKTKSLSFSREDILNINDCDVRILDLGFLTQVVAIKSLRETIVYEPVHKSLLEFAAAYAIWLSFKSDELGGWKEDAILLRPKMHNHSICFPFLSGLMGKQVSLLYRILKPYETEYVSEFGPLVSSLLETNMTSKVLNSLKPFLPVKWVIPWVIGGNMGRLEEADSKFSTSQQHEALVRFGVEEGRIKVITWQLHHSTLLPSDVEIETIVCELKSLQLTNKCHNTQLNRVYCKDLWVIFDFHFSTVRSFKLSHIHDIFAFKYISYNFIPIHMDIHSITDMALAAKDVQLNWLKINAVYNNTDCKYLIATVKNMIKEQRLKGLEILISRRYHQKHVDTLVKCAGKLSDLENFILRCNALPNKFYVDLAQLCDGGRKSWNWVRLEGFLVKCSCVIKNSNYIRHLDLESSTVKASVRDKFRCVVTSAAAIPSTLLGDICSDVSKSSAILHNRTYGTSNRKLSIRDKFSLFLSSDVLLHSSVLADKPYALSLSSNLCELNIVVEKSFFTDGLPAVPELRNLKIFILTLMEFEYRVGSALLLSWIQNCEFIRHLQKFEIWHILANPQLAKEIVEGICNLLEQNLKHCNSENDELNSNSSSATKLCLPCVLLNMPPRSFIQEGVSSISGTSKDMFRPGKAKLKQCLVKNLLSRLDIIDDSMKGFPMGLYFMLEEKSFPVEDGFRVQRDLWGTRQDDSIYSKAMHTRSPGFMERYSITYCGGPSLGAVHVTPPVASHSMSVQFSITHTVQDSYCQRSGARPVPSSRHSSSSSLLAKAHHFLRYNVTNTSLANR